MPISIWNTGLLSTNPSICHSEIYRMRSIFMSIKLPMFNDMKEDMVTIMRCINGN